jgi:Gpi18-like mannosyltransferase
MKKSTTLYISISVMLLTAFCLLVPRGGHLFDTDLWIEWALNIYNNGLQKAYYSSTNYMPLFQYILRLYTWMLDSEADVRNNIFYLKMFTLFFHFLTGFFILKFLLQYVSQANNHVLNTLFYLGNAAVLYNCINWNQVDIIFTCFAFISIYYAVNERLVPALLAIVAALNFKLQAVVFVPVVALLLFPVMIRTYTLKRLTVWIASIGILQTIIMLPFLTEGSAYRVWEVVTGSVQEIGVVSMSAYNMWHLLLDGDLPGMSDEKIFMGLSYKIWGLILFCASSLLALWPLMKNLAAFIRHRTYEPLALPRILMICALMPLLFFYFNTQMHERYSHPCLVFVITYSLITKRVFPALLACVAYVLNMEDIYKYFALHNYNTLIFNREFISALWLLTMILLYHDLYSKKLNQQWPVEPDLLIHAEGP